MALSENPYARKYDPKLTNEANAVMAVAWELSELRAMLEPFVRAMRVSLEEDGGDAEPTPPTHFGAWV